MKLKRYVLLNTNEIIDIKSIYNGLLFHFTKEFLGTMEEYFTVSYEHLYDEDNLKTSDNILDLVEVGDLIEAVDNRIIRVEEIETYEEEDYSNEKISFTDLDETYYGSEIETIYKRQINGDYKRYEIGGKE